MAAGEKRSCSSRRGPACLTRCAPPRATRAPRGRGGGGGSRAGAGRRAFDGCEGLYGLAARAGPAATPGACGAVAAAEPAVVLVVRLGRLVEGVVVTDAGARADPARATRLLERAAAAQPAPFDPQGLEPTIRRAAPA